MDDSTSLIQIFNESGQDIPVDLKEVRTITDLLAKQESCDFSLLEIVYVDEPEIVRINQEHLERNYATDIITFRYDDEISNKFIEGTLFCCAPIIYEHAVKYNEHSEREFKRVLIHGLLHLCGYKDDSPKTKKKMTEREDFYLSKLS